MNNIQSDGSLRNSKLNLNFLEKRLYPLFNALPLEVPTGWMIPFLFFIEDIQFFQYIFSNFIFKKLRPFLTKIFIIFDPEINNPFYFYFLFVFFILFICYMYIMIFLHLRTDGGKAVSKKSLWIYNSLFNIFFKYLLSFVFSFFVRCMYICNYSNELQGGIPHCDDAFNIIIRDISILSVVLISMYNYIYCNFNFNINCLSHAKYFGSIHMGNTNKMGCVKLIMAFFKDYLMLELVTGGYNTITTLLISNTIMTISFLFLAYNQLKLQPYYSPTINSYKFAMYFALGAFSLYALLISLFDANSNQFLCDFSPFLVLILFGIGYRFNIIYYKSTIKRIYKRFQEKQLITNLKKSTSIDELKLSPERLKNRNVYQSVERITTEIYIKKEIKVFNNYHECDLACKFLRYNRNIEAFQLMRKLFDEAMTQFKHEADIYIMAWYYIYSMKKFYKENNLLNKFDIELFNGESILINAMDLKLDMRKKYLINKALNLIEIEKREDSLNVKAEDVESSMKLEELKLNAVTSHVLGLKEIKELFNNLKNSTTTKDVTTYYSNITNISRYQNLASNQYNNILRQFPDSTDVIKIYIMFLMDVMNKDEVAFKYSLGLQKTSNPNTLNAENDTISKALDKNLFQINKDKKSMSASSNSLLSNSHSEDFSSSGLGKELRKKIAAKASMTKKYIEPIKSLKFKMTIFIILFVLAFSGQAGVTMYMFENAKSNADILSKNINIPGAMKSATFAVRLLSISLILGDMKSYGKYLGEAKNTLTYLDTINMLVFLNIWILKQMPHY